MTLDVITAYLPGWLVGPVTVAGVMVLAYLIGRAAVGPGIRYVIRESRVDDALLKPLSRTGVYLTVLFGIAAGLIAAGYNDIFGLLGAIIAAGTFAIGFAMKDTLGALIAGVSIFVDKPFMIGDHIAWDDNEGIVTDIRIRTTKVETFDNEVLTVPNDSITGAVVKNYSAREERREDITVGISYDDDIEQAKYLIHGIVSDIDGVLDEPNPSVRIDELSDAAVNLKLRFWIANSGDRSVLDIKDELYRRVMDTFDEEGINMPYPTYTINGGSLSIDR